MARQEEREREIRDRLRIEPGPGGVRLVVLDHDVLGRLTQGDSGKWRLEWRGGWRDSPSLLEAADAEHAEAWAAEELAALFAVERKKYAEGEGN